MESGLTICRKTKRLLASMHKTRLDTIVFEKKKYNKSKQC